VRNGLMLCSVVLSVNLLAAQTPQPFPRPGETQAPRRPQPAPTAPAPSPPAGQTPPATKQPTAPSSNQPQSSPDGAPPATEVWFPVYPAAQFLTSYDAGRGQRYYIYGATAPFADVIMFYRSQLDERGSLVFKEPPTHMFEVGRFRDETMAFPPGVTIKDWTWGGSAGYLNPKPKAQPQRFPTIIMIVPPPPTER
jgi:hypothetical protein